MASSGEPLVPDRRTGWRKIGLTCAGLLVCLYALGVLWYVRSIPDIGLRCAFGTAVKRVYPEYVVNDTDAARPEPQRGDVIVKLGARDVHIWPQLLRGLIDLRQESPVPVSSLAEAEERGLTCVSLDHGKLANQKLVRVRFSRPEAGEGQPEEFDCWCVVGSLPLEELVPSILWLFLKLGLFAVGALVFWKRPGDPASAQFFILCIVTLGAYMGGYHWSRIATEPVLLLTFMVCGVLLPPALLHFNLVFPRTKDFLERYPRRTLLVVYGPPLLFLAWLIFAYSRLVWRFRRGYPLELVEDAQAALLQVIYAELAVAALWYLASVACLMHSYRTAATPSERNQVKWIRYGSFGALVAIGYSLYLAGWERNDFAAGAATWPMFMASVCFTVAFGISITRYRLMQLDQLVSSGVVYFLISFLAGLVYYAVVCAGMLAANLIGDRGVAQPSLTQTFWVIATVLVLMLILDVARGQVRRALDRRFYREKYQLDRTLRRMGQAIEQLVDPPTLARRLLQASAELLGVPRGAVYLREGDPPLYRLAGALGPPPPLAELSSGCPLVEALRARGAVVARPGPASADDPSVRQLRLLGGAVAHALAHEGRLLALLVLGPKEPGSYGPDDLNLLAAFAQLTALALDSAQGHRTMEGLNRELQAKVEKISEQQRRILALQSQLSSAAGGAWAVGGGPAAADGKPVPGSGPTSAPPVGDDPGSPDADGSRPATESCGGIIGSSPLTRQLLHLVRKVAATPSAVLIRGESGTGKELLARALHDYSPRAGKAFVTVHCAALSPGLLESELFGHVKGAFTGAHRDKVGRFELADGGTLFLDEIGDIALDIQTKLLRALQEMAFERVGSSTPIKVDVRVIAATHQDLEELIRLGRFRTDLYYRLNVISIPVPPLRERREDVVELALHFLRLYGQRCAKGAMQIDDDALAVLKAYDWPGNVRQLENVIHRAVVVAEGSCLTATDLPPEVLDAWRDNGVPAPEANGWDGTEARPRDGLRTERDERDRAERERLVRALAAAGGNKAEAARALGLARSTLISRLKKLGLT
jgi:transcriptional regulator with GAF, ATPase, and Fis domain